MELKLLLPKLVNRGFWRRYWRLITAIVGGVIIVVLFTLLLVSGQHDVGAQEAGKQIVKLTQNIRSHYRARPDFWGLSTKEVIAKKIYPSDMMVDGVYLKGYFNNRVEIGADENGTPAMPTTRTFVIAYKGLSQQQCLGLTSNEFEQNFWLAVSKIELVSNQKRHTFDWSNKEFMLPPKKNVVKNLCSNNNTLVFYFE